MLSKFDSFIQIHIFFFQFFLKIRFFLYPRSMDIALELVLWYCRFVYLPGYSVFGSTHWSVWVNFLSTWTSGRWGCWVYIFTNWKIGNQKSGYFIFLPNILFFALKIIWFPQLKEKDTFLSDLTIPNFWGENIIFKTGWGKDISRKYTLL